MTCLAWTLEIACGRGVSLGGNGETEECGFETKKKDNRRDHLPLNETARGMGGVVGGGCTDVFVMYGDMSCMEVCYTYTLLHTLHTYMHTSAC